VIERTRIATALKGVRGRKPVDMAELERLLVRFSSLVIEQQWIKEIDINPLMASSERLIALDARIVLYSPDTKSVIPPAIRPYPSQYVRPWKFENGEEVLIRPIKPEDEPRMVRFHATLSDRSVYMRYFHLLQLDYRVSHERLIKICFNDYDREMALVALQGEDILAVGRLTKLHGANEAEFAVLISDEYQGRGLGTELVHRLVEIARDEKVARVHAEILPENQMMQNVCRILGFNMEFRSDEGTIHAVLDMNES
jgi:acetyltransferase